MNNKQESCSIHFRRRGKPSSETKRSHGLMEIGGLLDEIHAVACPKSTMPSRNDHFDEKNDVLSDHAKRMLYIPV